MEILIFVYVVFAVLTYGISFAALQRGYEILAEKDYWVDMRWSLFFALFGPVGFIGVSLFLFIEGVYFKHGLKFK